MNSRQFTWEDRFNTGVDVIDKEHRKLFSIINRLLAYSDSEEKGQWVCQEGIKYFKKHAMKHFAEEEVYMASINYSGFDVHRRLHDAFRKKTLPEIEAELQETNYSTEAVSHFLSVCAGWLIGHTLTEDRAITGKTLSKWTGLLPEDEHAALKKVIVQLLYDLFQLDSKVVSESYNGEKFGKGIYYRLVYGSEKGEKWDIMLVFEEQLLLNTIGKLMGDESDTLNVMMMNVTRYTARQFVERIRTCFPVSDSSEIIEENLLTYEQFQKVFGRLTPQCSFLFDTGEGYFAYCMTAPHLLKESFGPALKSDNAMDEIKKYLSSSETGSKKKILLVDDSSSVRTSMKTLLEKDYDVVLANSGFTAIRCMVLDKPDLVLLDYEMPVCSGVQVLEMIRAENELADIPIVFLAEKPDKETINKIVSLKPAGCLPKTMNPQEMKDNIDKLLQL